MPLSPLASEEYPMYWVLLRDVNHRLREPLRLCPWHFGVLTRSIRLREAQTEIVSYSPTKKCDCDFAHYSDCEKTYPFTPAFCAQCGEMVEHTSSDNISIAATFRDGCTTYEDNFNLCKHCWRALRDSLAARATNPW